MPLRVWCHYHSLSENLVPYVAMVRVPGEDDKVGVGDGAISVQICVQEAGRVWYLIRMYSLFDAIPLLLVRTLVPLQSHLIGCQR